MSSWLTALDGLVTATIAVAGFAYTYTVNRRAQYDRVLELTAQASIAPIAEDRHVAGSAFEPTSTRDPSKPVSLKEHEIKAAYNVLWYFERADAVYVSLRPLIGSKRITRVQELLLRTLISPVRVWNGYLQYTWVDVAGEPIDATEVIPFLEHLTSEYGRLDQQKSRRLRR